LFTGVQLDAFLILIGVIWFQANVLIQICNSSVGLAAALVNLLAEMKRCQPPNIGRIANPGKCGGRLFK
jgi:hypothetical protein